MTPEQYQKFKQDLKESQQRAAETLARIDRTLSGVKDTLKDIEQNNQNIQKFKKAFDNVMISLAEKLTLSMGNPFKKLQGKVYQNLPQSVPIETVVKAMLKYKKVLIITGAGVSAPSGIPTFRGQNGLYDKKFQWQGKSYEPEEFITNNFYTQHPMAIWNWIDFIYKMSLQCKPNKIHILIDQIGKILSKKGLDVTVVTQNIDNLHLKPQKQQYKYEAIHGNTKYIRCSNNHLHEYSDFRSEIIAQKVVKCPKCGQPLRPHVLFFDESYGPLYGDNVKDQKYPFVFVIGSSLSTGLCTKLTVNATQVVEINPQPVIQVGKVYQFKQDTAETLSKLVKAIGSYK